MYIYSPSGPSWPAVGWTLPLPLPTPLPLPLPLPVHVIYSVGPLDGTKYCLPKLCVSLRFVTLRSTSNSPVTQFRLTPFVHVTNKKKKTTVTFLCTDIQSQKLLNLQLSNNHPTISSVVCVMNAVFDHAVFWFRMSTICLCLCLCVCAPNRWRVSHNETRVGTRKCQQINCLLF